MKRHGIPGTAPVFILFLLIFLIEGCVSKSKFLSKIDENETLAHQLETENKKAARLEQEKKRLKNRLEEINQQAVSKQKKQSELIQAQTDQLGQLEADRKNLQDLLNQAERLAAKKIRDAEESIRARENLIASLNKEIKEGNVKISQMNDQLSVQIVSKILFPSGSDQVTGEGKNVLKKVSDSLKSIRENKIRIEGHTDNIPIGPGLSNRFPTNWELSTARATRVVRYLAEEKVDPNKLVAVGMAEYNPVASNETPEGRQKNRRIEIILTPQ